MIPDPDRSIALFILTFINTPTVLKPVTDKLIRFFASVEWSLLFLRISFIAILIFILGTWGSLFSKTSSPGVLDRINCGFPLHPFSGFWILILSIAILLILIHVGVVILVSNSGGKYATLSAVQGLLAIWMPIAFLLVSGYRYFETEVEPGKTTRFLSLPNGYELAIVDHSGSDHDGVYAIDWKGLSTGKKLRHKDWDFHLEVKVWFPQAVFADIRSYKVDSRGNQIFGIVANRGAAVEHEIKMFSANGPDRNAGPGMLVEVFDYDDESLGTYLVGVESTLSIPPQEFQVDDRSYSIVMRHRLIDPGFQWTIVTDPAEKKTILQIFTADHRTVEEPIDLFHSPKYKGYRFRLFPDPSQSPVDFNSVRVVIIRNPWGAVFTIVTILTIIAALVHCVIHLRMLSREADQ